MSDTSTANRSVGLTSRCLTQQQSANEHGAAGGPSPQIGQGRNRDVLPRAPRWSVPCSHERVGAPPLANIGALEHWVLARAKQKGGRGGEGLRAKRITRLTLPVEVRS